MTEEAQVQTSAVTPTGVQPETQTDATNAPQEAEDTTQPDKAQKEGEAEDAKPAEEPFPKKAVNAIQRRDRTIRQLRAQMRELNNGQPKAASAAQTQSAGEPQPDSFESYGEYLKARQDWLVEEKFKGIQEKREQDSVTQQHADIRQKQTDIIGEQFTEIAKSHADFKKVMQENAVFLQNLPMPPEIENILYELDNTPLAVYALVKEGRLEDVYSMSPHLAAAELIAAQDRGRGYLTSITQAPKPMTPIKGASSTNKSLSDMTPDEIVAWVNKK